MPKIPKKKATVREPIQVYLTEPDRSILDRAAVATGVSRAEVLRRGLRAYGAEVLEGHEPVVEFLDSMAKGPWAKDMPNDVGARHDHYLTEEYLAPSKGKRR